MPRVLRVHSRSRYCRLRFPRRLVTQACYFKRGESSDRSSLMEETLKVTDFLRPGTVAYCIFECFFYLFPFSVSSPSLSFACLSTSFYNPHPDGTRVSRIVGSAGIWRVLDLRTHYCTASYLENSGVMWGYSEFIPRPSALPLLCKHRHCCVDSTHIWSRITSTPWSPWRVIRETKTCPGEVFQRPGSAWGVS